MTTACWDHMKTRIIIVTIESLKEGRNRHCPLSNQQLHTYQISKRSMYNYSSNDVHKQMNTHRWENITCLTKVITSVAFYIYYMLVCLAPSRLTMVMTCPALTCSATFLHRGKLILAAVGVALEATFLPGPDNPGRYMEVWHSTTTNAVSKYSLACVYTISRWLGFMAPSRAAAIVGPAARSAILVRLKDSSLVLKSVSVHMKYPLPISIGKEFCTKRVVLKLSANVCSKGFVLTFCTKFISLQTHFVIPSCRHRHSLTPSMDQPTGYWISKRHRYNEVR